jgi:hypothetical protein
MGLGSGTPLARQACAVLDARREGVFEGMFHGIKAMSRGSSNAWIIAEMRKLMPDIDQEEFDYWVEWLGLEKA